MARLCSICTSPSSARINTALAGGVAIAALAQEFENSESALRRHAANHLQGLVLGDVGGIDPTTASDLLDRLQMALDDVDRVRASALASGRGELVVKAAAQTRALVETLSGRMGIDDLDIVQMQKDARQLVNALGRATRRNPSVGHAVVEQLRVLDPRNESTTADALEQVATAAEAKIQIEK